MSNLLELNFNDKSLSLAEGSTPEWIGGNNYYKVKVNISKADQYDYFHIILADGSNKQVIEVGVAILENLAYIGKFYVPRILGNNTRVNLGIIAKKVSENNVIVSSPLTVTIKSGIAQPVPFVLEEDDVNNSGFTSLLNLLEDGKVLKDITLVDRVANGQNGQYLKVQFQTKGDSEDKYLGPLTQNLIQLGAQIERRGESGGGGKLGYSSVLFNSKSGFAGGYEAATGAGAAIGNGTYSESGVAIGLTAKTEDTDGIAIGRKALVNKKSVNSIAIGDYAEVNNSPRSILISSVSGVSYKGEFSSCERSVGLGYRMTLKSVDDAIAIGSLTRLEGRSTGVTQNSIAIGMEAASALSAGIAIGPQARAGFETSTDLKVLQANVTDEKGGYGIAQKKWRSFGGIAIGAKAFVRRGGGVALGRFAKAYGSNSISIGNESISGNKKYNPTEWKYEKGASNSGVYAIAIGGNSSSTGTKAISIGYDAKATAEGAVQIGPGTNSTPNSLQFGKLCIIKDGKLQIGSSTSSTTSTAKVTHPLKKIESGNHTAIKFTQLAKDAKSKKPTGLEQTVTFNSAFGKVPNVVCTLKSSKTSTPYDFGLVITEITKTYFKYKIFAVPSYKSSSESRLGIQWIAVEV